MIRTPWTRMPYALAVEGAEDMPLFVIERNFAEQLEVTRADADQIIAINDDAGMKWLFSFLSASKKKTYCLYEAPSADAIREAAQRAGVPADVIIEVDKPCAREAAAGRAGLLRAHRPIEPEPRADGASPSATSPPVSGLPRTHSAR